VIRILYDFCRWCIRNCYFNTLICYGVTTDFGVHVWSVFFRSIVISDNSGTDKNYLQFCFDKLIKKNWLLTDYVNGKRGKYHPPTPTAIDIWVSRSWCFISILILSLAYWSVCHLLCHFRFIITKIEFTWRLNYCRSHD
jgi:hypothetical protein